MDLSCVMGMSGKSGNLYRLSSGTGQEAVPRLEVSDLAPQLPRGKVPILGGPDWEGERCPSA